MDEDLSVVIGLHDVEEDLDVAQLRLLPVDGDVDVGQPRLRDEKALLAIPLLVSHGQVDHDLVALLAE